MGGQGPCWNGVILLLQRRGLKSYVRIGIKQGRMHGAGEINYPSFSCAVTAMFERLIHSQWAAVPLRLIVGYGFMAHGYAKIVRGPDAFVSVLHSLGVPKPHVMAWVTILVELLGGFAVFVGAFVPLVSLPLAGILVTAMLSVHLRYGFSSIKLITVTPAGAQFGPPGYEIDLLYLACLAALVLVGPGPHSVDGLLSTRRSRHDEQSSQSTSPSHSLRRRS